MAPVNNLTAVQWWWNDTLRSNDSLGIDYDFNVTSNDTSSGSGNDGDVGDAYDDSVAQKILDFLNLYYLGVIICIGLLGNGRNIVLFILNPGRNERLAALIHFPCMCYYLDYIYNQTKSKPRQTTKRLQAIQLPLAYRVD